MDNPAWISLFASVVVAVVLATVFGYWMNQKMGAGLLFVLSGAACAICIAGAKLGKVGLIMAMIVVAALAYGLGNQVSRQRGAWVVSLAWVGWCAVCVLGYQTARLAGLASIALPAVMLFWIGAYWLAPKLLPLRDKATRSDRLNSLRALLTYTLGTNYPYYTVENRKATLRVKGNPFQHFFAGPGIIITSCDHTIIVTNNFKITQIPDPGLTFTGRYENINEVVDLRAQLHAFPVEAITKDGIPIKVLTFVPFRIYAADWPRSGAGFPFRKSAAFQAVQARLIEPLREQKDGATVENRKTHAWDETVDIVATQIVRRIVSEYTFDDLCAPYQPQREPRKEIIQRLRQDLKNELGAVGIEPLGGGISNLLPVDNQLLQQRIGNWQAEWARRITAEIGKGEAEYIRMVESARAQAQAEMIRTISEGFEKAGTSEEITSEVIALRFVETLEKMIQSPEVQQALPPASAETVEAMKHSLETHRH
jgi:regulator of protease activity HflC (stomatin/prohibitin superfamily)